MNTAEGNGALSEHAGLPSNQTFILGFQGRRDCGGGVESLKLATYPSNAEVWVPTVEFNRAVLWLFLFV